MTDPVADLLTRIRNALLRRKESVSAPHSKLKHELLKLLVKEGFISGVKKVKRDFAELDVSLKYVNEESAIREIQTESKPGLMKFVSNKHIKPYKGGLGIRILSTSKGLRTDKQAIKDQLGGEIICRVF